LNFQKGRLSISRGQGFSSFETLFDFRIISFLYALPALMPFLFFLLITSCVENQRERKKTAIALKREMPLNAHQSGNRIISLIIRIIIINKNEFSHFQSNNSKIKTKFFSSSSSPFLLLAAAQEALLGLHSILGTNCIPANRVRVNLSFREYKEDWSAHGFLCSNRWRHRGFDGTFNQSHAT